MARPRERDPLRASRRAPRSSRSDSDRRAPRARPTRRGARPARALASRSVCTSKRAEREERGREQGEREEEPARGVRHGIDHRTSRAGLVRALRNKWIGCGRVDGRARGFRPRCSLRRTRVRLAARSGRARDRAPSTRPVSSHLFLRGPFVRRRPDPSPDRRDREGDDGRRSIALAIERRAWLSQRHGFRQRLRSPSPPPSPARAGAGVSRRDTGPAEQAELGGARGQSARLLAEAAQSLRLWRCRRRRANQTSHGPPEKRRAWGVDERPRARRRSHAMR